MKRHSYEEINHHTEEELSNNNDEQYINKMVKYHPIEGGYDRSADAGILPIPTMNWAEIRHEERQENADRRQAFNSRPAPAPVETDYLPLPRIDWAAERRAGR